MSLLAAEPARRGKMAAALRDLGAGMRRHQRAIQATQWIIVGAYLFLVAVPAFLPLPDNAAHVWNNLTVAAQFAFWGLWWPFVLLSMVLVGRTWCGIFCPEGALTEFVSRHGRGGATPRWMTWKGWPFTAFACTTVYGQLVSVYQYAKPALLILGGSTAAAMVVGYLYGRNKRVWCRYLCPVNGVFGLLAKLAPVHFAVDEAAWAAAPHARGRSKRRVDCAPLVVIKTMRGAGDCHVCGRCSGFRDAVALTPRAPNDEIVRVAGSAPKPWETWLIVFGLMGIAAGAFHWSVSPWFVAAKQAAAEWLVDRGILWPLSVEPPWWMLTHYPAVNDTMNLLDGAVVLAYIGATAFVVGTGVCLALALATLGLGRWSTARFHHLAQTLIPMAACGVFLGLSALTVTLLRIEGLSAPALIAASRGALLVGAVLWSAWLGWQVAGRYVTSMIRRGVASVAVTAAAGIGAGSWVMLFWLW